jgi:hypothetical protein
MTSRSAEPQAASEIDAAADDHDHIERELDELEALVRAAHDADLRSATSTLMSDR